MSWGMAMKASGSSSLWLPGPSGTRGWGRARGVHHAGLVVDSVNGNSMAMGVRPEDDDTSGMPMPGARHGRLQGLRDVAQVVVPVAHGRERGDVLAVAQEHQRGQRCTP